jgi:hypothetical protein
MKIKNNTHLILELIVFILLFSLVGIKTMEIIKQVT